MANFSRNDLKLECLDFSNGTLYKFRTVSLVCIACIRIMFWNSALKNETKQKSRSKWMPEFCYFIQIILIFLKNFDFSVCRQSCWWHFLMFIYYTKVKFTKVSERIKIVCLNFIRPELKRMAWIDGLAGLPYKVDIGLLCLLRSIFFILLCNFKKIVYLD